MKAFYNTCNLTGEELRQAVAGAKSQEEAILLIYMNHRKPLTASKITELTEKAGHKWPIWSNRRAITNLKSSGDLRKCGYTVPGPQGKPEHPYEINSLKYPVKMTA